MSITILPKSNEIISDEFYIQNLIEFNISQVSSSLANSLRRVILSNTPNVTFDDAWDDLKDEQLIHIIKNNSGLHNEFLSHRLSLIPIYRYNDNTRDVLKISTLFNKEKQTREYIFTNQDLPIFHININSDTIKTDTSSKNRYGLFEVTTNHIEYSEEYSSEIDCSEYFPPDLYIQAHFKENNYIILNMLKSNEALDIYMKPTIGIGNQNARYCNVGTVSYMFEQDESKFEKVFNQTIEYENQERVDKKINRLGDDEIEKKKKTFMVLDKERVFKTDKYNEPNSFNFCVESIGILPSHQIVYDALMIFKLKLYDIIHSFDSFEQYGNQVIYNPKLHFNNTIQVLHSIENLYGYKIMIQNENHTLGNVINHYLNILYVKNYITNDTIDVSTMTSIQDIDVTAEDLRIFKVPILEQCGYKMPHPLKEELEFKLKIRDDIPDPLIQELYESYSIRLMELFNIVQSEEDKDITMIDKHKTIIIYTYINSILSIIQIVSNLIEQWEGETTRINQPIRSSSFTIGDPENYFKLDPRKIIEEPVKQSDEELVEYSDEDE